MAIDFDIRALEIDCCMGKPYEKIGDLFLLPMQAPVCGITWVDNGDGLPVDSVRDAKIKALEAHVSLLQGLLAGAEKTIRDWQNSYDRDVPPIVIAQVSASESIASALRRSTNPDWSGR